MRTGVAVHPILQGMLRAVVLAPGVIPLGLLAGATAALHGFGTTSAVAFSATVFAGATQFATLALLGTDATLLAAIATVALLNARYLLLSAAALDMGRRSGMGRTARILLALGVVEESYALQAAWERKAAIVPPLGLLAIPGTLMALWLTSTAVGVILGARLPALEPWGLDYALPGIFIGLFGIFAEDRRRLTAGLVALACGAVFGLLGWTLAAALLVPPVVAYVFGRRTATAAPAGGTA